MVVKQVGIERKQNETRKKCDVKDKLESLGSNAAKKNIEFSLNQYHTFNYYDFRTSFNIWFSYSSFRLPL